MKKLLALVVISLAAAASGLYLTQDPARGQRDSESAVVAAPATVVVALASPPGDEPTPPQEAARIPDLFEDARAAIPNRAERGIGISCSAFPDDFHGIVVDGLSGRPVVAARVVVASAKEGLRPAEHQQFEHEVLSDEHGRFRLELGSGPERGLGSVLADGYGPGAFAFDRRHDTPERAEWIELLPPAALEVQVNDASGSPFPWAAIELAWPGEEFTGRDWFRYEQERGHWRDFTDEAGQVRFTGLPAEAVLAWSVRGPTLGLAASDRIALAPNESRRIAVVLAAASVTGVVRDEQGVPVAELELALGPAREHARRGSDEAPTATATSDAQGRFEFSRVPCGAFELGPASDQDEFVRSAVPLSVDRARVTFDLTVTRGLAISGRVLGTPEELRGCAFVQAMSRNGGCRLEAELGEDGSFHLAPLAPGEVLLRAWSLYQSTESRVVAAGASDIELGPLQPRTIQVRVEGAAGELDYTVLDLVWGTSYFWRERQPSFEWTATPGVYAFAVTTAAGLRGVAPEVVVAGAGPPQELAIRLERPARVTCVHRARDRSRDLRLFVGGKAFPLLPAAAGDSRALLPGAAREVLVPAGELRAELWEGERMVVRSQLDVLAGEHRRLVLELP